MAGDSTSNNYSPTVNVGKKQQTKTKSSVSTPEGFVTCIGLGFEGFFKRDPSSQGMLLIGDCKDFGGTYVIRQWGLNRTLEVPL